MSPPSSVNESNSSTALNTRLPNSRFALWEGLSTLCLVPSRSTAYRPPLGKLLRSFIWKTRRSLLIQLKLYTSFSSSAVQPNSLRSERRMVSRLFLPSRGAMAASHWPSGERRIRLNSGFLKKVSTGSFSAWPSGPSRARARPSANGVLIVCMLLRSSLRSGCPRKGLNCTVWVWGIQQAKALHFCATDRGRRGAHTPSRVGSGSTAGIVQRLHAAQALGGALKAAGGARALPKTHLREGIKKSRGQAATGF